MSRIPAQAAHTRRPFSWNDEAQAGPSGSGGARDTVLITSADPLTEFYAVARAEREAEVSRVAASFRL